MLNISGTQAEVDGNRSAGSNDCNANDREPTIGKLDKDTAPECGAPSSSSQPAEKKPWDALKETVSFRRLLELDGHQFTGTGKAVKCRCPFHDERTPSFVVFEDDARGKCYGCDWYGNIFDYEMKAHDVSFGEALRRLQGKAERLTRSLPAAPPPRKAGNFRIAKKHQEERAKYSERLLTDEWLRTWICEKRANGGNQWSPETLMKLAKDGSLGWSGDALSFHYRTGTKYREFPGRRMLWDRCNIGISMWREERIEAATHIYIAEGETDAITLIELGLEEDPDVAVIAISGASSFNPSWSTMFAGKRVTLCFDIDEAGERALESVGSAIMGKAASVSTVNLKEVA